MRPARTPIPPTLAGRRRAVTAGLLAAALAAAGCTRGPEEVVRQTAEALERGDLEALERRVAAGYADARGDRSQLFEDLERLLVSSAARRVQFRGTQRHPSPSARTAAVQTELDLEWIGPVVWRVRGPVTLELVRQVDFRVEGGLLVAFREAEAVARARRAALEANDPEALRALLHPAYRDGNLDADGALHRISASLQGVRVRLRPTHYRLELRSAQAHLDEHYVLTVGTRTLPPAIARFTLERTAGRLRIAAGLFPSNPQLEPGHRSH